MSTVLRRIGVAALALCILSGLAESGPRPGNPPTPNVQLDVEALPDVQADVSDDARVGTDGVITVVRLITYAPTLTRTGNVKYSAKLKCTRPEGVCIASATMTLTLEDGSGGTIDSGSFTLTTPTSSWKTSKSTSYVGAGTYCTFAHAEYTTVDGGQGTVESTAPVCASL